MVNAWIRSLRWTLHHLTSKLGCPKLTVQSKGSFYKVATCVVCGRNKGKLESNSRSESRNRIWSEIVISDPL